MSLNERNVRRALEGEVRTIRKANVWGYSKKVRRRNRVPDEESVIRIYVEEKKPLDRLAVADIIPTEIDGIPTDVEAIGVPYAAADMKSLFRPLVPGCSIGNINITTGSLCYGFERIRDKEGPFLGSNKHVFSDVLGPTVFEKRIVQPGPSDGGSPPIVGTYFDGIALRMPLNPFNALWMVLVNAIYQLFGQYPPYDLTDSKPRHLDFALAKLASGVDIDYLISGFTDWDDFCGIWFATSDIRSFFCKAKYITEFGYQPIDVNVKEAIDGDIIYKGDSRSTPRGQTIVLDDSMFLWVNYGGFGNDRPFDDIVMTDKAIIGGDSGTAAWLTATFS